MVGICGIVGNFDYDLEPVTDTIVWAPDREHDARYREDNIDVYVSVHDSDEAATQPASTKGGHKLCIWGDVLGFEGSDGYEPRDRDEVTDAEYCATLVEEHGLSFIDGLNSEFAGLVLNESDNSVTLFTDRLGARPIYYTESIDGAILFSTHPRTILAHPEVVPTIDAELIVEFLTFERVFGTKTPFKEVRHLHPGSQYTYDLERDAKSSTVYWQPEYNPAEKSYDKFVSEFTTLFHRAVEERRRETTAEGVLISGGSDSRLLLSALGDDVTGYHMNERLNTEAETAKQICDIVGAEFRFLERNVDYQKNVLSRIAEFQIYSSFFDQAHAVGFEKVFHEECDDIFCGQYSDTLLSGHYMPKSMLYVPVLGWNVPTSKPKNISNIDGYVDYLCTNHKMTRKDRTTCPEYVRDAYDIKNILNRHLNIKEETVFHHGVKYPSFENLGLTSSFYPLSNAPTYLFYYSLNQIAPTHYPYLDNRIVDLALSMPRQYQTRRNIVNASLNRTAPDLASIPHAETGLPLSYPTVVHSAADLANSFAEKFGISRDYDGSYSDHNRIIRESSIVTDNLLNGSGLTCWGGIDSDSARNIYERHCRGEDRYFELYGLLSLCKSYPFKQSTIDG